MNKTVKARAHCVASYDILSRLRRVSPIPSNLDSMEEKTGGGIIKKIYAVRHSEYWKSLPLTCIIKSGAIKNYKWDKDECKEEMDRIINECCVTAEDLQQQPSNLEMTAKEFVTNYMLTHPDNLKDDGTPYFRDLKDFFKEVGSGYDNETEDGRCSLRWWDQIFVVQEMDGRLIGYEWAFANGDKSVFDLGWEFDPDTICFVEPIQKVIKTYRKIKEEGQDEDGPTGPPTVA